jgi:hypothetical protein
LMTAEESESAQDMGAAGQSLATMGSEQLLQSMKKDPAKICLIDAVAATGKRTPRKRTKTAKLAEAEELAAELSRRPAKKVARINSATPLLITPEAGGTPAPAVSGSSPSLFKPVQPKSEYPSEQVPIPGPEAGSSDAAEAAGAAVTTPHVPEAVEQQSKGNLGTYDINAASTGALAQQSSNAAGREVAADQVPASEPLPVIPPAQDPLDEGRGKLCEDIVPSVGEGAQATIGLATVCSSVTAQLSRQSSAGSHEHSTVLISC